MFLWDFQVCTIKMQIIQLIWEGFLGGVGGKRSVLIGGYQLCTHIHVLLYNTYSPKTLLFWLIVTFAIVLSVPIFLSYKGWCFRWWCTRTRLCCWNKAQRYKRFKVTCISCFLCIYPVYFAFFIEGSRRVEWPHCEHWQSLMQRKKFMW